MPRTILAGNWKMHKTAAQTRAFFEAFFVEAESLPGRCSIVIAPPFTAIPAAHLALREQSRVALGAQTMHWEDHGAYTGEISPPMLLEHGVSYVIIGHSERRAYCNELDRTVNMKVAAALHHGLTPIVAVGETLDEREAGLADERVAAQTHAALAGLADDQIAEVVIAYEPIWAIGTGKNCDPAEANRIMGRIRSHVSALHDAPILYGGSMKADNVASYMAQEHINGGLIGGASLEPAAFATLIRNAAR